MMDSHSQAPAIRPFTLEHSLLDPVWVVRVRGEIDRTAARELGDALWAAWHDGDGTVVVDLCDSTFRHLSALQVLLLAHRRLTRARRRLVVACPEDHILQLMDTTRLSEGFEMHPSLEDALAAEPAG